MSKTSTFSIAVCLLAMLLASMQTCAGRSNTHQAVFNVTQPSDCLLQGDGVDFFEWNDRDEVQFVREDKVDTNCQLLPFRTHPYFQEMHVNGSSSTSMLIIGDSFDLHMCLQLSIAAHQPLMKADVMNCFLSKELQVKFHRIGGLVSLKPSIKDWIDKLQKQYVNQSTHSFGQLAPSPDFILFSSFAWDLLLSHRSYCHGIRYNKTLSVEEKMKGDCHCNFKQFDGNSSCQQFSTTQEFDSHFTPWCRSDFFHNWKTQLKLAIKAIQDFFPNSTILLRNQPASSSLFMGGMTCMNMLNQEIRHIALQECGSTPRLLDVSALMLQGIHHLGTNTGKVDQPRDHLHYFSASHLWTDYAMNIVLTIKQQQQQRHHVASIPCKV